MVESWMWAVVIWGFCTAFAFLGVNVWHKRTTKNLEKWKPPKLDKIKIHRAELLYARTYAFSNMLITIMVALTAATVIPFITWAAMIGLAPHPLTPGRL